MSRLAHESPNDLSFTYLMVVVAHGKVNPRRFFDDASCMRKRLKALFPVVTAHAACADTTKGHMGCRQMDDGVIDAATAKRTGLQHLLFMFTTGSKKIQRERFWSFSDERDGVIKAGITHHGQEGAEDFLLHDGRIRRHLVKQGGRNKAPVCVTLTAGQDHLPFK